MLIISSDSSNADFFKNLSIKYPNDIFIVSKKNFNGTIELLDIVIALTPSIVSSLTIILHEIISYIKSKKENKTDITIQMKKSKDDYEIILKSSNLNGNYNIDEVMEKTVLQIDKLLNKNE